MDEIAGRVRASTEKGFTIPEVIAASAVTAVTVSLGLAAYTGISNTIYLSQAREAVFNVIENDIEKIGLTAIRADRTVSNGLVDYNINASKCAQYGGNMGISGGVVNASGSSAKVLEGRRIKVNRVVTAVAPQLSSGVVSNRGLARIDYYVSGLSMGLDSSLSSRSDATSQLVVSHTIMPEGYSRC